MSPENIENPSGVENKPVETQKLLKKNKKVAKLNPGDESLFMS